MLARRFGRRRADRLLEAHHLHGELHHQPVVAAQVEARELHDPPQSLAERVLVDVQRLGRRADVAAVAMVSLGIALMRRTDPEELGRQRRESERFMDAWARGMAQASGA